MDEYLPPEGDKLGFDLTGAGYSAPEGGRLSFDFRYRPPYIPPAGNQVPLAFGPAYTPPAGNQVALEFVPDADGPSGDTQYVFPHNLYASGYGYPEIIQTRFITPAGIASANAFGDAHAQLLTRYVGPAGFQSDQYGAPEVWNWNFDVTGQGFVASLYGKPEIRNTARQIRVNGLVATSYGKPQIWNWLQIRSIQGFSAALFGAPYVLGGVKYVAPNGLVATRYGQHEVINPTADQHARPSGIAPPSVPWPSVSPRIIYPAGLAAWRIGTPWVQRNPSPLGFVATDYGLPWVSYGTRYLYPSGPAQSDYGFPRVWDRNTRVYPQSVLRSAVFGDAAIINRSHVIRVLGDDFLDVSPWATVESNRRGVLATGWDASLFGAGTLENATPSFAPHGFDAAAMGTPSIGYRVRYLWVPGQQLVSYGRPTVTRTPSIEPKGFTGESGTPTVWFSVRNLDAPGYIASRYGEAAVWFRQRRAWLDGFDSLRFGTSARVEHGVRELLVQGANQARYGSVRIANANRTIAPEGIFEDFAHEHMVGGDRWLKPLGFDASAFGSRIIPEIQAVYPQGFSNPYGWPTVYNQTQIAYPGGFTTGHEPADQWGRARVFNLLQHVTMYFDPDSHLNPPAWPQWTKVENRNRAIGTAGTLMERFGITHIENNARPVLPAGIAAPAEPDYYQAGMVAYRIRHLPVQGMESPYISTWAVVYNDAFVIAPAGFKADTFGEAIFENTRRYFRWIGNFDASEFGQAMVAYRVRELTFEGRYTIGAPVIPLPEVKLHTRYVEPVGPEFTRTGLASLSIHWKKITTRWAHQDFFGWAEVRNLTPEVRTRGRATDEFGDTHLRLQWRPVHPFGEGMALFGRTQIADRDRVLPVAGIYRGGYGRARVTKTGAPPYSEQTISLLDDYGIGPPGSRPYEDHQVPSPGLNQYVLYPRGFSAERYGSAAVRINGATLYAGIRDDQYGEPHVGLKNRVIVQDGPAGVPISMASARIDPHTIWAVKEAPQQAKNNHPPRTLHYVGEVLGANGYPPGERFGRHRISTWRGIVNARTLGVESSYGRPSVYLRLRFIEATGIRAYRFGWHKLGDGTQFVTQFAGPMTQLFGRPAVVRPPYTGPQTVRPSGVAAAQFGAARIEFFHRELRLTGFGSLAMGTRRPGDSPYMWQGLRIGPLMPTIPEGVLMSRHGEPWVTFRVRQLSVEGFDAFVSEYDIENFPLRMRVRNAYIPTPPEQEVEPVGLENSEVGVPNIRPGVHFIRPDGNADQYRKGAF